MRLFAFSVVTSSSSLKELLERKNFFLCGDSFLVGVVVSGCVARPLSLFSSFFFDEEALYFWFAGVLRVRLILIVGARSWVKVLKTARVF